jgi:hypothetical protein
MGLRPHVGLWSRHFHSGTCGRRGMAPHLVHCGTGVDASTTQVRAMGCGQVATHEVRGVVRRKDQRLKVCREHIVWMVSGKEIRVRSLGRRQSPIRCDFCERNATGALVAQWTDRGLGISGGGPRRQESRFCETHKEAARDRLVSAAAQGGVDNPGLFGRVLLQR